MNPAIDLPQRIRRYRRRLGESQTEFGVRFGVTRVAVGRWESGTLPNGTHLQQIIGLLSTEEAQPEIDGPYQISLPFEKSLDLVVKMSPQASHTIHFEVRIQEKAS